MLFISEQARLSHLVHLPETQDLGAAVDTAMRLVETHNTELADVLPNGYQRLEKSTLVELLRLFSPLPRKLSGDAFGLIYEDFLSNFAMAEGRLGGEFFTPHSIVRLIVEIIEPFHGRVFDPACGSGGMFVQCVDVPGLCRVATLAEIEAQGWSLNPGRYTGTALVEDDGEDFADKLGGLYDEFTRLSDEADALRAKVDAAVQGILGA